MGTDQVEFKISEGLIRPIIEAKINAAIVEAMGGHDSKVDMMAPANEFYGEKEKILCQ